MVSRRFIPANSSGGLVGGNDVIILLVWDRSGVQVLVQDHHVMIAASA
jgi:hypothetical protein